MTCDCASCRQRAAWTPAERRAFDRDDARDEALEHEPAFFPPDSALTGLRLQKRRPIADLTGRRFGRLTVEGPHLRERPDGHLERAWDVTCSCGWVGVMRSDVLKRGATRCHSCAVADANRRTGYRGRVRRLAAREMRRAA